ncbi:MAG: tryptophan synthase subunit alpha [Actinomycetota bacterium]|nr:tryptophan synthase subunit alpha [Actinomycetota bacterium]
MTAAGTAIGAVAEARTVPGALGVALRARRAEGAKLLVPYVTGGLSDDWTDVVAAVVAGGADAVEVGIPFSDPVMDGPTIQEASVRALDRGTTPASVLAELARVDAGVPLVAMTYYNLAFRMGDLRFARSLAAAGVAGAILPDLPLEESLAWEAQAAEAGVETVLLAAPVTPPDRLATIARRSRGFVYGVSRMGITGERASLAASAAVMARRLKAVTDTPVLIGFGISTPAQAVEVCAEADGVVVASALLRELLDGGGPQAAAEFVGRMRAALDAG